MKSRKESLRVAKKLFKASLVKGQLDLPTVRKIVRTLGDSKPRGYLGVLDAFWKLVRLDLEKNQAIIASAVELDSAAQKEVVANLKKKYGPQITTEFIVRPELIGGMKIRIGSDVWDGSVKGRLERLEEKFN